MKTYKICSSIKIPQRKLNKLKAYGELTYLGNFQYKIDVEDNKVNEFIVKSSRNGIIVLPY